MVPMAMLLARIHSLLVPIASVALWAAANGFEWNVLADASDGRGWYFDPFAWQLIFFTGFSLGRGWIRTPAASPALVAAAGGFLALGVAISLPVVFENLAAIDAARLWIKEHSDKTYLDLLQYFHFLAEAYLVVLALRGREQILLTPVLKPLVKCGQQALSVFVSGMVLSHAGGMVFDQIGDGVWAQLAVNFVSFGALILVAYTVGFFKAAPWKKRVEPALLAPASPPLTPPVHLEALPAREAA